MPKDVIPPPPAPRYEGFRWLGSQWGRSGKPNPSWIGGVLMLAASVVVFVVAVRAATNGGRTSAVFTSVAVGVACLVAAGFYFVEAHFASRAKREQVPTVPDAPTGPSVGP